MLHNIEQEISDLTSGKTKVVTNIDTLTELIKRDIATDNLEFNYDGHLSETYSLTDFCYAMIDARAAKSHMPTHLRVKWSDLERLKSTNIEPVNEGFRAVVASMFFIYLPSIRIDFDRNSKEMNPYMFELLKQFLNRYQHDDRDKPRPEFIMSVHDEAIQYLVKSFEDQEPEEEFSTRFRPSFR